MPGPVVFAPVVSGLPLSGTDLNNNWGLVESSLLDVAPYVVGGLVPTIGAGLSVNVSLGTAVIGAQITPAAFVIGSLAPSTTNHLYLLRTGVGMSNTTGTPPAASVKLGTCVTGVATVTSVATGRNSGRQQFLQPQALIPGGPAAGLTSAGHPDAINLASWNATDAEGFALYGTLPAGAMAPETDTFAGLTDVSFSGVAQGDLAYRGAATWNNLAHGTAGQVLTTNGAGADPSWQTPGAPDLSAAVILAPNTPTRNTIQPAADANAGLIIQEHSATQGAPLLQLASTGGDLLTVLSRPSGPTAHVTITSPDDDFNLFGIRQTAGRVGDLCNMYDSAGNSMFSVPAPGTGNTCFVAAYNTTDIAFSIIGPAAGTVDLFDVFKLGLGLVFTIDSSGGVNVGRTGTTAGFLGAAAVVRQTNGTAAALAAIIDPNVKSFLTALSGGLVNFGLFAAPV